MSCNTTTNSPDHGDMWYINRCCQYTPTDGGGQGVTYWGHSTNLIRGIPPHSYMNESFTCTTPKCYDHKEVCNMCFFSRPDTNANTPDIELNYWLNGYSVGGSRIPGQQYYGVQQAWDFAPTNKLNDTGLNNLWIYNNSSATVYLYNFEIIRVYNMKNIQQELQGQCASAGPPGSSGTLDSYREDYPCNTEQPAPTRSVTQYLDNALSGPTLNPGDCFQWNWDFTNYSNNYKGPDVCLFNFNQMWPTTNSSTPTMIQAYINGNWCLTGYLSTQANHGAFPSVDIMSAASNYYNDMGANSLTLLNNGPSPIQMAVSEYINIYRVYKTDTA